MLHKIELHKKAIQAFKDINKKGHRYSNRVKVIDGYTYATDIHRVVKSNQHTQLGDGEYQIVGYGDDCIIVEDAEKIELPAGETIKKVFSGHEHKAENQTIDSVIPMINKGRDKLISINSDYLKKVGKRDDVFTLRWDTGSISGINIECEHVSWVLMPLRIS